MFWFVSGCVLLESAEIEFQQTASMDTAFESDCHQSYCVDFDQDGYPAEEDCNDQDGQLIGIVHDYDCDGYRNEIDPCPEDPFNDLDQDGICGELDAICNMDFTAQRDNLEEVLDELQTCTTIEGDLYIYDILESELPVFESLLMIEGNIIIGFNTELKIAEAFPSLHSLSGVLRIQNNRQLQDLGGFDVLSQVERVEIFNNPELCRLEIARLIEELGYPDVEQRDNNSDC